MFFNLTLELLKEKLQPGQTNEIERKLKHGHM
jgi:hypothetical protein